MRVWARSNGRQSSVLVLLAFVMHTCVTAAWTQSAPSFHHSDWAGSSLGTVMNIQQDAKGYLWLTTSTGIFRFDGVRFQTVDEVTNGAAHNSDLSSAFVSSNGGIWLATRNAGLLLWRDSRITSYPSTQCVPAPGIRTVAMAESLDGSLWMQAPVGLVRLQGTNCEPIGADHGYPGGMPAGILVDRAGTVWVKTWAGKLLFLKPGSSQFQLEESGAGATANFAYLHEAPDQSIWLSDDYGLRRVRVGATGTGIGRPPGKPHREAGRFQDFAFASDGSIWAATDKGVRWAAHPQPWQTVTQMETTPGESFTPKEGLSSDYVWKIFLDRERTVWIGTGSGLDQFRQLALHALTLPAAQQRQFGIAAGDNGSVWTGSRSLPLTHITPGEATRTFPDTRQSVLVRRDQFGTIWSSGVGKAYLWRSTENGLEPVHYPEEQAQSVISLAVDRKKDLWINLRQFGVFRRSGETWSNENQALGKAPSDPGAMASDAEGNVWFAFSHQLVRWDGTSYSHNLLVDGSLNVSPATISIHQDHVWIGGPGGIVLFTRGRFRLLRCSDEALPGRVSGIVETNDGNLWISSLSGVTHISATEMAKWVRDPQYATAAEHLDEVDGLPGTAGAPIPEPSVVQSQGGRLWFATTKGIAWLDPAALQQLRNRLPPPVDITAVTTDGRSQNGGTNLRLRARLQNLQIDYTALSLAVPDRVLFRYKLDGVDADWQNVGTRRQAFYTNLLPGRYRFHVTACNNDGVWNPIGASLNFTVAPAFNQTWWFRALLVLGVVGLIAWMIRFRMRFLVHNLHERLAERLAERERIAGELHDTLLQNLFGLTLSLQGTANQLAADDPLRQRLNEALDRSDAVMKEGRARIRDLRSRGEDLPSLSQGLAQVGRQLATVKPVQFDVKVDGEEKPIDPSVLEEVLLIGREALTNAFRHSDATLICVELLYGRSTLQMRIHDNGRGLEGTVLLSGSLSGHWGLLTMRERARRMHADIVIGPQGETGTQVLLRVPASMAYHGRQRHPRWLWAKRLAGWQRQERGISDTGTGDPTITGAK